MRRLIVANMVWNTLFVLMGLSEMLGVTTIHPALPSWGKWAWLVVLAAGNLLIHVLMLVEIKVDDDVNVIMKAWVKEDREL